MKFIKNAIAGIALMTGLAGLAAPASADWNHGRELSRDRRDLAGARAELRHDLRQGAGHREIARDRAAVARERREIWADSRDWRYDRSHRGYYRPWYRW
jgi:outer membrane murein-binding lipoprotein Lpp